MSRTLLFTVVVVAALCADRARVAAQVQTPAIVGAWVLNADLSDQPPAPPEGGDSAGRGRGRRPGGGGGFGPPGGGGRGGGGFGRGGGRGGPGGGMNREEMERRMNAIRDVVQPAERLTITATASMVIVTAGDGRTTRLAPDNSKIKEVASGIERKTRWEGDRLVTEISGLGRGKATETYAVDPDTHRLVVLFEMSGANAGDDRKDDERGPGPRMPQVPRRRVYDPLQP